MLKKVITIVVLLCLIFSISVMSVNAVGEKQQGGGRGGMHPMSEMPSGEFTPPQGFAPPEGNFTPPQNAGEFAPPKSSGNNTETTPSANGDAVAENEQTQAPGEESNQVPDDNQQFNGQMPGGVGEFDGNMQNFNGQTQEQQSKGFLGFVKTHFTPIISVILLGLAFVFVIFYRRKNY